MVTGANRGIGLEIARLLADKGITVVLTARCRQQQDLSPQSRALMEEGRKNVVFHTLDIQRDDSVTEFAQWLKNEFGGLDILVFFLFFVLTIIDLLRPPYTNGMYALSQWQGHFGMDKLSNYVAEFSGVYCHFSVV